MVKARGHLELEQRVKALECEIHNTKHIDSQLMKRDESWESLINNTIVGFYRVTEKGKFLSVNRKFAQIYGFDLPNDFLKAVPDVSKLYLNLEDRQRVLNELQKNGFVAGMEVQARHKDGRTIRISISARKIEVKQGETGFEGFVVDVSDRKHIEESVQESENRFRLLVEQAGDAFFIHDYAGRIFDVNNQACQTLGYEHEELLNMSITDIDVEISNKKHISRFWECLASGQHITFEGIQKKKNGFTFPVEVRLGRLDIGGQKLLLSLCRDITERKLAEDKLKKAFQEITELKNCLEKENIHLRQEIELTYRHEKIVGESTAIRKILHDAERVAKGETYILIQGETGTGKELLARAIHNMSPRKGRPMVMVNCAALPPTLIEGELFGREKGAYTGALTRQAGRFEMANGSTLFLDEIGDLPQDLQAKLLRVLQDGRFERLGSSETISVNVRVIAATNQNLWELVQEKKFRADLYYRLNVFPIVVPPLRERIDDIPLLVWAFVREFNKSMGKSIITISSRTMDRFQAYSWPGNIRELRNVIERAMIVSSGTDLHVTDLNDRDVPAGNRVTLNVMEKSHIVQILERTAWRVSGKKGAAQVLGLNEATLRARMKKLGIQRPG